LASLAFASMRSTFFFRGTFGKMEETVFFRMTCTLTSSNVGGGFNLENI
jgi:hypothetical protein